MDNRGPTLVVLHTLCVSLLLLPATALTAVALVSPANASDVQRVLQCGDGLKCSVTCPHVVGELLQVQSVHVLEFGSSHTLLEVWQKSGNSLVYVGLLIDSRTTCVFQGLHDKALGHS